MTIMYKGIHFENVEQLIEYQEKAEGLVRKDKPEKKGLSQDELDKIMKELERGNRNPWQETPSYPYPHPQQPYIWNTTPAIIGPQCIDQGVTFAIDCSNINKMSFEPIKAIG